MTPLRIAGAHVAIVDGKLVATPIAGALNALQRGWLHDHAIELARAVLDVGDPPVAVRDDLVFARCPFSCRGEGSSLHTRHRLAERGAVVPAYLDVQIAATSKRGRAA